MRQRSIGTAVHIRAINDLGNQYDFFLTEHGDLTIIEHNVTDNSSHVTIVSKETTALLAIALNEREQEEMA